MRNQHPGTCYRCGQRVEAGAGHFEKVFRPAPGQPKWRVQHAGCAIVYRGTDKRADRSTQTEGAL